MVPGAWQARKVPAWMGGQWNDALGAGVGLECTEEAQMRCGAEGDPKWKVPRGMMRAWMPAKAGPFSRLDTRSSMAFNYDRLVDPRGDPVGEGRGGTGQLVLLDALPW